jgi:hypothetical protein
MSKIDLSKANVGDKFRLKNGVIATYKCYSNYPCAHAHILESGLKLYVANCDGTEVNGMHEYDVIEQVLDKPLDELIEEGTKQIKKNDDAIKEENELQRRQEVVELAEKMYIMFEKENLRCCLSCNESTYYSEDLQRMAFVRASSFVNKKHEYLKEGKL